jgi:GxxExxY protein
MNSIETQTRFKIENICNTIFDKLGQSHNECVYQKALVIELYNMGADSVETEKHVLVFYEDEKHVVHTIGSERIDILARFGSIIVLMELKATTTGIRNIEKLQLTKYINALSYINIIPSHSFIVNFNQTKTMVDFLSLSD